ncbi:hypothetical protein HRbin12_01773 [bacterium HR12]|nr:hypothetical protein HRbin12_01773 [bacterium HR12]
MQRLKIALFLTAVGVIGIAPVLLVAVYAARRRLERTADDRHASRGLVRIAAAVTGALVVVGGALAWTFAQTGAPPSPSHGADGMGGGTLNHPLLPEELAGQRLTEHVEGPEAITAVQRLHGAEIPLTEAEVAVYGNGLATIWRSGAPDAATATEQVELMRERIADGGSPFDTPHPVPGHAGVYATRGMGLRHFFFARGTSVWWLAADPDIARSALLETLEVAG